MEKVYKISKVINSILEDGSITEAMLSTELADKINNKQDKGNYALVDSPQSFSGLQTFSEGILIDGTLTINGDIVQNRGSYETYTEQVYSTKDYIYLREGNLGALEAGSYSGFEFKNYDGANNGRLVIDNTGTARVGDVGDEQPLATREEIPLNGGFAKWDTAKNKFITDLGIVRTVVLNIDSSRVLADNIVNLTEEEIALLNPIPENLIVRFATEGASSATSYSTHLLVFESNIYTYSGTFRIDEDNASVKIIYTKASNTIQIIADSYKYTLVKINNTDSDILNFTSDPQTQINNKYTKPTTGIPESDLSTEVREKLNNSSGGSDFTPEEITALRALLSKVTVGTNIVFNTTVEAPAFNDID